MVQAEAFDPVLQESCSFVLTLSAFSTDFYYCQVLSSFNISLLRKLLLHICPAIHTNMCAHTYLILHQKPLSSQHHEDNRFKFSEFFLTLIWLLLILTEGSLREDKEALVSVARKKIQENLQPSLELLKYQKDIQNQENKGRQICINCSYIILNKRSIWNLRRH